MSDTDRTLAAIRAQDTNLADKCDVCGFSATYCRAVTWFDVGPCCDTCSHERSDVHNEGAK